jgi:molecular chaperone DnaJ
MSKKENKGGENYYTLLELSNKCTKSEIDNAYRRLAIRWHPDKNKDNKEASEKKFREISKAYQILSDETTRSNYDKHGIAMNENTDNLFDPYEMFKGMFETEDNQIPDVVIKIETDIKRLYIGFTETIKFTRFSQCNKCESTGTRNRESADCVNCKGRGILMETVKGGKMGYMINEKPCDVCEGKGINPEVKLCRKCTGNKYIKDEIECDVDVPPGAYDNYYIKLEEEGNYIPKEDRKTKKSRTDVIVVIKELLSKESPFRRGMFIQEINRINLADILLTINISFGESIVGVKKEIDFLAGETIAIDIDEVIYNGDIYVIKNMGMPLVPEELEKVKTLLSLSHKSQHQLRGDLFLHFKVDKPMLSKQKRNRMWQIITDTPYPDNEEFEDDVHPTISLDTYIKQQKSKPNKKTIKESGSLDSTSTDYNSTDSSIEETTNNDNSSDNNSDYTDNEDSTTESNEKQRCKNKSTNNSKR